MTKLRTLDLFTGIGGTHLALSTITKPVAYCEINDQCVEIIKRRLPRAPIFPDITKLTAKELLANIPKDAKPQLITASFPCQDISSAGRGDGIGRGTRSSLVFDVFRLADEIGPSIELIFLENSPMIKTRGLEEIVKECRKRGFNNIVWTYSSASDVGAHHVRRRWFLLASRGSTHNVPVAKSWHKFKFMDKNVSRLKRHAEIEDERARERARIGALGNAVVPASLAHAWNCLSMALTNNVACVKEIISPPLMVEHLNLVFGSTGRHQRKGWSTPVYNYRHYYPTVKFEGRHIGVLASQVFHEQQTQKTFKFKDVKTARQSLCLNPEWVEALMGFPGGWTDVNKKLSTAKHFTS